MSNHAKKFRSHIRINESILGALERKVLLRLAKKMPDWVTPDLMTFSGFLATLIIFLSYWLSNFHPGYLWLANLGFILNWVGDSLDGTLARYRHIERPQYGFYVDHTTDALGQIIIITGLGISPYISFTVALLAVIAYLLLSIHVYIRTYVVGVFRISYLRIGPTEVRMILILFNTAMFFFGIPRIEILSHTVILYDVLALVVTGIMFLLFLVHSVKGAIQLQNADRNNPADST
ncbi:MAG: CDP-alcohol phosphatidyltransferase family protein [Fidelibacterota bacterium]